MIKFIDLNADLGENAGDDESMLQIVSSANIACGAHAGDAYTMKKTVEMAAEFGVNIGAHPGFWDKENFGRIPIDITSEQVYDLIMYQIGALMAFCAAIGKQISHIKPHGALYNMLMSDYEMSLGLAKAAKALNIPVMGMPYSQCEKAANEYNVSYIKEGFADRAYTEAGRLMPRKIEGAVLDYNDAVKQAELMVTENKVIAEQSIIKMNIDSICVHGDSPNAVKLAKTIKQTLNNLGYRIGKR